MKICRSWLESPVRSSPVRSSLLPVANATTDQIGPDEFSRRYPIGNEPDDEVSATRLRAMRKLGHRGPYRLQLWMQVADPRHQPLVTYRLMRRLHEPPTDRTFTELNAGLYAVTAHESRYTLRSNGMAGAAGTLFVEVDDD